MKIRAATLPLALLLLQICGCHSSFYLTLLSATSDTWTETYCAVFYSEWGSIPKHQKPEDYFNATLPDSSDPAGCASLPRGVAGLAVVEPEKQEECIFYQQALVAQLANTSLLVVIHNSTDLTDLTNMEDSFHGNETISLPVVFIANDSGQTVLTHMNSSVVYLAAYTPKSPLLDPSGFVIFIIAVITIFLAPYIANAPYEFMRYGLLTRRGEESAQSRGTVDDYFKGTRGVLGVFLFIMVFLVAICTLLVLLYYFYYPLVYVVIALFCVGTFAGLYFLVSPFVALIPFLNNFRLPKNKIPVLESRPDPRFFVVVLLCAAVVVWWGVERHAVYAWVLQDILGFAFVAFLLSRLLFLRVWVVAVLMIFLFFYDIFMVFITPFFTEDHESVMVKAATGGGSGGGGEQLPIVFVAPKFLSYELGSVCEEYSGYFPWSLLGYGDVGIPGVLVALCLRFDLQFRPKKCFRLYYCVSGVAYVFGLILTFVALSLMQTAQPALLYLVPTTLGTVTLLALIRREFGVFFTGKCLCRKRTPCGRSSSERGMEGKEEEAATAGSDLESETEVDHRGSSERDALIEKEEEAATAGSDLESETEVDHRGSSERDALIEKEEEEQ